MQNKKRVKIVFNREGYRNGTRKGRCWKQQKLSNGIAMKRITSGKYWVDEIEETRDTKRDDKAKIIKMAIHIEENKGDNKENEKGIGDIK